MCRLPLCLMISASHASSASFMCYNRKVEVEQEPLTTEQARNLKSSTFTQMAQQHHHVPAPRRFSHLLVCASKNGWRGKALQDC